MMSQQVDGARWLHGSSPGEQLSQAHAGRNFHDVVDPLVVREPVVIDRDDTGMSDVAVVRKSRSERAHAVGSLALWLRIHFIADGRCDRTLLDVIGVTLLAVLCGTEDMDLAPKMVMRDNDTKLTSQFDAVFESSDGTIKRNTPLSPNLRAHVERFIQTLQVECLDKFVIVAQRDLNHVCRQFEAWCNTERLHEACDHLPPAIEAEPEERTTIRRSDVVCNMRLGGAPKSYSRRAA